VTVPALSAINTETITDTVHRVLRQSIVDQRFKPGEKLNPDELAQQFGVSRTPVHEALVMLSGEGLVEVVPRRGTFVTELSVESLIETMDIRRALEGLACETAAELATAADVAELRKLIEEMDRAIRDAADPREAARGHDTHNQEFHRRLVNLSGNQRLIELYRGLDAHLKIARTHVRATRWIERVPQERREHEAIVEALSARDSERLKVALDAHLRRSTASLISDIRSRTEVDEGTTRPDPNTSRP
jgi:DNA-binding GntR family transcriptional regulator